jgi:hypothetical protein
MGLGGEQGSCTQSQREKELIHGVLEVLWVEVEVNLYVHHGWLDCSS